ncbi:unnamed protein product [Prorocentrum cordatum]|uniref:Uncharacterized protein n=1 Tax=Prorocentrum cordatum TaxID=2364126 RepID=A0ABN9V9F5_9DINO|nr:unnamed protein product [Polarella glacialis]
MATGGDPPRFPRSRGERSEAARRARAAADAAVRHARARAGELEKEVARLREVIAGLTGGVPAAEPGSWQDREAAARPALILASGGRPVPGAVRFRRNTALHAARAPAAGFAAAPRAGLAWAAAGPRLGGVLGRGAAAAVVCEVEICVCEVPAGPSPPAPPRRELPEAADARRTPLSPAPSEQLGLLQGDLAKLSGRKGALEEGDELTVELEALPQRLCALEDTAEPKAELEALSEQLGSLAGDAATVSERQGAFEEVGAADAEAEVETACSASEAAPQASTAVLAYLHAHPAALLSGGGGALEAPVAGGAGPGAGFEGSRARRKRGASMGRRARRVRFDLRPVVIGTAFEEEAEAQVQEGAEPTVELQDDLAALSVRQGALEEGAEARGELEALSQRPCAQEATSEQLVSQKGDLAALSERQGALEEGTEPKGEREVLSKPASRHAFSECLFFFLGDFSVAAVLCVAIGPKTGVEALLSSAEARFLGVRPGTAGWPDAEERERVLEGRLQVVQILRADANSVCSVHSHFLYLNVYVS